MTTDTILDFDKLLAPIAGDNPVGVDLRVAASDVYYQLKDARSAARTAERKSTANGESIATVTTSWQPLLDLCIKAISEQTKDLEVASWLTESLARIHGFAGLSDGLRLLRELITNFWPAIYPAEDEEGSATKIVALTGLNGVNSPGTLIMPIHCIPIVSGQGKIFATWQYQQALEVAKIADAEVRKQRIENGAFALDDLKDAAKATNPEFFAELKNNLQSCQQEFTALETVLAEKCAEIKPELANISRALADSDEAMAALTKHLTAAEPQDEAVVADNKVKNITASGNRQELFKQLQTIADFFRRTEPHSPLSYLLEKTIRWGDMELPELMQELLTDGNILADYYRVVGIKPPQAESTPVQPNQNVGAIPNMGGAPMGMDNQFNDFGPPGDFNNPGGQPPQFPGG